MPMLHTRIDTGTERKDRWDNRLVAPALFIIASLMDVATTWYALKYTSAIEGNPFMVRTTKFSINHMMDAMGFTAELEAAYQSYFVATEMRDREIERDDKGGIAQTRTALQNLESTKPWLESTR